MKSFRILAAVVCMLSCADAQAEFFVDLGISANRIESRINAAPATHESDVSAHVGIGGRRPINDRSDIGFRLELDRINSTSLAALRAFDYRRHPSPRFAYSVFAGAARLDLATPAYGWYLGGGVELLQITEKWNLGIDLRIGDRLARDNLLPGEAKDGSPDNFHSVTGVSVYLTRRF